MFKQTQATRGTRPDSPGYGFLLLSATGVVFPRTAARLAFEAGGNPPAVAVARGVIATPIRFENPARERS